MKNRRRDVEPLEKRVVAALKDSYELGYSDGIEDGNIHTGVLEKKLQEAYDNGLNNAWECAKKIYDFNYKELAEVFPESDETPFDSYSASEAITRIKEYEERQKQDTKEKIKVGDEVYLLDKNYKTIVTQIYEEFPSSVLKAVQITQTGKFTVNCIEDLHKTGKNFSQIAEILNQLRGENDADSN